MQLPFSSDKIKHQGKIENRFLYILTNTTGGFSNKYPDGKTHFKNEYYYVGKINTEGKNFKILVAEIPATDTFDSSDITPAINYSFGGKLA